MRSCKPPPGIAPGDIRHLLHQNRYHTSKKIQRHLTPILARPFTSYNSRQFPQKQKRWVYLCAGLFSSGYLQQVYASYQKKRGSFEKLLQSGASEEW